MNSSVIIILLVFCASISTEEISGTTESSTEASKKTECLPKDKIFDDFENVENFPNELYQRRDEILAMINSWPIPFQWRLSAKFNLKQDGLNVLKKINNNLNYGEVVFKTLATETHIAINEKLKFKKEKCFTEDEVKDITSSLNNCVKPINDKFNEYEDSMKNVLTRTQYRLEEVYAKLEENSWHILRNAKDSFGTLSIGSDVNKITENLENTGRSLEQNTISCIFNIELP